MLVTCNSKIVTLTDLLTIAREDCLYNLSDIDCFISKAKPTVKISYLFIA